MLEERLRREGYDVCAVSFPDYDSDSSALIKMYLRGDFGTDADAVNPYAASTFYAVDRFASYQRRWKSVLDRGGIVIADRYTTSNMLYQMIKFDDPAARRAYLDWLEDLEYRKWVCLSRSRYFTRCPIRCDGTTHGAAHGKDWRRNRRYPRRQ